MKTLMAKDYVTVDHAAKLLNVNRAAIYRWIRLGLRQQRLPAKKFGGTLGIPRTESDNFRKLINPN